MTGGPVIELRSCTADDEAEFRLLALDPRVTAHIGDGTPWDRATADARFRRGVAACERGWGRSGGNASRG